MVGCGQRRAAPGVQTGQARLIDVLWTLTSHALVEYARTGNGKNQKAFKVSYKGKKENLGLDW